VSGKDLSAFFQQWLYQAGYPKLAVQWHFEPICKVVTLKVEQVQDSAQFAFPLDLAIQGGDGKMQLQTVRVNQKNQTFTVPVNSAPKLVSVDPMVRLLLEAKVEPK
jgi:aminopeptidase N